MARIADATLETIRQRVDITELVKEYVPELKRAGRNSKARCPFHQEKTPSFIVNPEKQIFHCFGCQESGDIFSFLMKMESLGFSEAVEKLAARAGVTIAPSADQLGPREREFLKMREALAFAQEFYSRMLAQSPEADAARRYVTQRGLDEATRERFGIGFALPDGSSFLEAALRKGLAPDLLAKAGLVSLLEGKGRYRDFFRGRVLFPIRNTKGDVVGFGGRVLGDGLPKYINSPDTALFSKGRVLYGLYEGLADARKSRKIILLEGYMDVIAMHQFGLRNACAPLGTAVTPDHADILKRYAEEAILVFDPDDAGSSASLRGAELLLERGFSVRIATVPDGLDPDELLHRDGVPGFAQCFAAAVDLPDFQTTAALAKVRGPLTAETKDRIGKEVLATIAKAESDIIKAEWIHRLSERLKVDESHLRSQMSRQGGSPEKRGFVRPSGGAAAKAGAAAPPAALSPAEQSILQALFKRPDLALDESRVTADDFEHSGGRRIFSRLKEMFAETKAESTGPGEPSTWSALLLQSLSPEDATLAGALLVEERGEEDPERCLGRAVDTVRLVRRYRELQPRVAEMQEGRIPPDAAVFQEYQKVMQRLSALRLLDHVRDRWGKQSVLNSGT